MTQPDPLGQSMLSHMLCEKDEETTEMVGESIANTVNNVRATAPPVCNIKEYAEQVRMKTHSLCTKLYTLFTKHPHENQQSYAKHALKAIRMALRMGKGAIGLCIHSVFPFLCEKTGTNTIERLHDEIHEEEKSE